MGLPTLTLRPTSQLKAPSPKLSSGSPIFPVTASLVKSLMKADLEEYGPPNPLATPPLRQETFSKFQAPIPAPAEIERDHRDQREHRERVMDQRDHHHHHH